MQRYIVGQLLNTFVVRDTQLLKAKKNSVVAEFRSREEANDFCGKMNSPLTPEEKEKARKAKV